MVQVRHIADLETRASRHIRTSRSGSCGASSSPRRASSSPRARKVIERALNAGLEPVSFLMGERWLEQFEPLFGDLSAARPELDIPVFIAPMELMEELTGVLT